MIEIFSYNLSITEITTLVLVAILIGMAKAGIAGAGMIAVPLLAISFGGKDSSGILLPILIIADVFAVAYYHRHANWFHLKRLLPFAFIGVIIGTILGDTISDDLFKAIMAAIIFISLLIMLWREKIKSPRLPDSAGVSIGIGISGGIATMVGNLAGPIMSLYLLAMRLPKAEFIGTAAWFFLIINLSKVPSHVLVWETINLNTVLLDIVLLPAIALGVYIGITIISKINDAFFRILVITMTAITAIAMVL